MQQVQRQVFPKGRPADTAGFSDEPAATQSTVVTLDQRLDALERQMTDILRQSEENGNRLRTLESDIGRLRSDQEQRIQAIERQLSEAAAAASAAASVPAEVSPTPTTTKPKTPPAGKPVSTGKPKAANSAAAAAPAAATTALGDAGEAA